QSESSGPLTSRSPLTALTRPWALRPGASPLEPAAAGRHRPASSTTPSSDNAPRRYLMVSQPLRFIACKHSLLEFSADQEPGEGVNGCNPTRRVCEDRDHRNFSASATFSNEERQPHRRILHGGT